MGTQKKSNITIESSSKMDKGEIEKLREDAEKYAEDDKIKMEKIELRNEAESMIYTTEKLITQDLKDKISQDQGIKITDAIRETREALDKDSGELKAKLDALKTLVNQVSTELYQKATQESKMRPSRIRLQGRVRQPSRAQNKDRPHRSLAGSPADRNPALRTGTSPRAVLPVAGE